MNFFRPNPGHMAMTAPGGEDRQGRGLAMLARRMFPKLQQPTGQPPAQVQAPSLQTGGGGQMSQAPQLQTGGGGQPSTLGQMYQTGGGYQPQPYSGYPNLQTGGGMQQQSAYQQPQGRGLLGMWQSGYANPYGWGYGNER